LITLKCIYHKSSWHKRPKWLVNSAGSRLLGTTLIIWHASSGLFSGNKMSDWPCFMLLFVAPIYCWFNLCFSNWRKTLPHSGVPQWYVKHVLWSLWVATSLYINPVSELMVFVLTTDKSYFTVLYLQWVKVRQTRNISCF